jgi:hypothetical protein
MGADPKQRHSAAPRVSNQAKERLQSPGAYCSNDLFAIENISDCLHDVIA